MSNKFDELAKSLAGPSTRRQLLKKFGFGLAATALACFGLADKAKAADAPDGARPPGGNCREANVKCQRDHQCCSGHCDLWNQSPFKICHR